MIKNFYIKYKVMVDQPNINIQLGDIIEILSENPTLNNNKFFVKYIDSKKITIINIENNEEEILKINENNELDESIEEIILLSRADFPGYAKQNNLIKGTWIDVYFKGDIPFIIIGKITDLVEDMIEIKTFPENEIIYIDFAYKGIPEDLPIEKIVIRTKPDASEEQEEEAIIGDAKETEKLEEDLPEFQAEFQIKDIILDADEIQIGAELEEITQIVDVAEGEQRYGIEKQTNDLLDELLSQIPNLQRTPPVMNEIHKSIERYKQLRNMYSLYDKNGNISEPKIHGENYKPMIENIVNEETGEYADILPNTTISVALSIDGVVVTTNNTLNGLPANKSTHVNLSWVATLGSQTQRNVRIEVNPAGPNRIPESRYVNNFRLDSIDVIEKDPELTITNVDISKNIIVNQSTTITATIKNNGRATNKQIYAKLNSSIQGEIYNDTKTDSLLRDKTHNFTFIWTPKNFGTQVIFIDIIYNGKTHDFKEITVVVEIEKLQWWNDSWHYRYILSVNGSGTVKYFINFTTQFNFLNINSKIFDNETIRIIQYHRNGSIIGEVNEYFFNESLGFDSVINATGDLIWRVSGQIFEKFYCIYFDVKGNIGVRNSINENESLIESGNAKIGQFNYVEGWWIDFIKPINGSFALINQNVNINVSTIAKAVIVSAYIYFDENESHNFSFSFNNENNTEWFNSTNLFDKEGSWTIIISGEDVAGYIPEKVYNGIFIGKPDLKIENITIKTTRGPESSNIYIEDIVNISANVSSINATVENVKISLSIFENGTTIYTNYLILTLYKNEKILISFEWVANISGKFNVSIIIDPENQIDEENELNNKLIKTIDVFSWPDLSIEEIILPTFEIMEFDQVEIRVVIKNLGLGDAYNYLLKLFIEPANEPMDFSEEDKKDSAFISINSNTTKTFYLYWDFAIAGSWHVAALVIYNDTKKDTNETNNVLRLKENLNVNSYEKNPPKILITDVNPKDQLQGGSVSIHATITDDTGLESVKIVISYEGEFQSDILINESMERIGVDNFIFIFTDTSEIGRYVFEITAVDLSVHKNIAKERSDFFISQDYISPTFTCFSVKPDVQLVGKNVEIYSIVSDNIGIKSVKVNITHLQTGKSYLKNMIISSNGVYKTIELFYDTGGYQFYIIAEDNSGNIESTEIDKKFFWITTDFSDTDNDGMPDIWEEAYGLDPRDPEDAYKDLDNDGIINLKEFENNGNPAKNIFSENAAYRLKENIVYLASSIILFIILFLLFLIGIRRR